MSEEDDDLQSLELEPFEEEPGPVFQDGEVVAGRFRIVRYLARGSMGELFEAEDLELLERVALKTILPAIADDERLNLLFKREVHLARQVTHPNICRIYDVFRHRPPDREGELGPAREVVFLAMELLHGETLAQRLRRGRLSTAEALPLARQMAQGLSAAHRVGVVHRDFKTQNVMLVAARPPEPDPRVVITDFGLARRYAADDRDASVSLSQAGAMSGTPAYMAPEQVTSGTIGPATDVYALGVVLYEMVTGTWPFHGRTALEVAVKRLREPPPPPRVHVPDLDPRWESAILRCLERKPADRFASAGEAVGALDPEGPLPTRARRASRSALAAGAAGTIVVALATFAWLLRPRPPRPAAEKAETVVLADFANSTGDAALEDTLAHGLATGLQNAPLFGPLPEGAVRDTLKLMGRAPGQRVTEDVAQELCQRTASRAVVAGSISMLGTQYVVALNATDCQTGDSLARETARAAKKEDLLAALGQATATLRQKVGDAVRNSPRSDTSIAQATTSSLDALKSYSLGVRANGEKGALAAIPLYERAIELDPGFAMAYASLGNAYLDLREHEQASRSFRRAHDLQGRVSDRERFALDAYYFANVTGELDKARQTHELWAQAYPRHSTPHTNLGVIFAAQGRHEDALRETLESLRLYPDSGAAATFLVANYCRLGRLDEARAAYARALPRQADRPGLHLVRYGIAFLENDRPEMERQAAWAAGRPGVEDLMLSYQADTEASSGRLQGARDLSRRAVLAARQAGKLEAAAQEQVASALREAEFGDPALARSEATAALALSSSAMVQAPAALALARAGDADRAGRMAADLERQNPHHARINRYWLPAIRAAVEIARKDAARAIEILETATPYELGTSDPQPEAGAMHPVYVRGLAYVALKQGAAAAAEFQKFEGHRGVALNSPLALLARLGLARAHALQGDIPRARDAYARFFTLCKDADQGVPILQQARAEQARLLTNGPI